MGTEKTIQAWNKDATRVLERTLLLAQAIPSLSRRRPVAKTGVVRQAGKWSAAVYVTSSAPAMARLNRRYRRKNSPTDVLSFEAPEPFQRHGHLGELVICLPVLKRQARELGHSPERELEVLIVHGVLHLLGMEHESVDARPMARWESRLLAGLSPGRSLGLIKRARSGNSSL
ncbi:MAG TPA: rRNA maturation RNase YbeY [Bdellovibrionota bacterium]|nr:rRNA maturation RNase YbeY [Bdellovibrionota bacterium]